MLASPERVMNGWWGIMGWGPLPRHTQGGQHTLNRRANCRSADTPCVSCLAVPAQRLATVSRFCGCIGSSCLRHGVHGDPIGGGVRGAGRPRGRGRPPPVRGGDGECTIGVIAASPRAAQRRPAAQRMRVERWADRAHICTRRNAQTWLRFPWVFHPPLTMPCRARRRRPCARW